MTRRAVFFLLLFGFQAPPAAAAAPAGLEQLLCSDVKKPFFAVDCGGGSCRALAQRSGSGAAPFAVPKTAGTKRVFVLGESAAQLLGSPVGPGGTEIVNCGMGGYESGRIKDVFTEVLRYEPDLVLLLSGNNEGPEYPCPGPGPELRRRRARLLEKFYSLGSSGTPPAVRFSLKLHEERLDAMAALAAKRKVPLILFTLPVNLELPPPGALPLENKAFAEGLYLFEKKEFAAAAAVFAGLAGPQARFWLGRAAAARGAAPEAAGHYRAVLELDPAQGRASAARNAMIRRVAARYGAGLCDLEKIFESQAAGFASFADGVHWRQGANPLVWRELSAAAAAMGLPALPVPPAPARGSGLPDAELRKTFSYAVSGLDDAAAAGLDSEALRAGFLSEPALAELAFIEAERPGLAGRLARSDRELSEYFIRNAWSAGTAERLAGLRPVLAAHLAELERRRGDNKKALALAELAMEGRPEKTAYRLIRALALYGLGRRGEAGAELELLYPAPATGAKALAAARARGLALPPWAASAAAGEKARAASKKISDEGVALARAGDAPGATTRLNQAISVYPANAEALFSLCSLAFSRKDYKAALAACSPVPHAAASCPPGQRAGLTADGLYLLGRVLAGLGSPDEAKRRAQQALAEAPPGWARRQEAQALLEGNPGLSR